MNRRVWGAVGIVLLALKCLSTQAYAGLLNRQEIEKLLDGQYMVGEVQAGMPVYPLFAKNPASAGKPDLKGYAFESIDFKPVRGYSGKPLDVLVAMDLTGGFMDVRLVDHKEPFFNNPTGTTRLGNFAAQYIDLSLQHSIQVHDHTTPTVRDERSADLQGVNHGTVSVKAIDQSIVVSAAMVAISKLGMTDTGSASRRRSSGEHYKPLTWEVMVSRGMVSKTTFTRGDFARAFANTRSADADVLAAKQPNDPALIFHTALVSLPSIGRNLLDSEGWRYLSSSRRQSQALLVTESGPLSIANDLALRVADDLPFIVKQNGKTLKTNILPYDKGLKVPGYSTKPPAAIPSENSEETASLHCSSTTGDTRCVNRQNDNAKTNAPEKIKTYFLVIDKSTPLDPSQPFELFFKLGRQFGTNFVLTRVERREFPIPYNFNGWPAKYYDFVDTDWLALDWMKVWQKRWVEITALFAGLLLLTAGLIAQKRVSATSRRLKILRTTYLIFTLGFIGWFAQGQLTIINITAAVESLSGGGDLSFLLNDPMTVILWIFTLGTLLVWGRSTFCGWLCPFGALQELISMIANAVGLHQRRLHTALDAKLKWIKYAVLATIIGSIFVAPSFAELAVKIEPFETAISFYFMREWPYILWAAACLSLGVVVYRGYCRYICPLGAALAAVNIVQRWSWIPRREECGKPCQSCRHRCEYQAITPAGTITYSECFQCLDCVAIYQDDQRCLPLIQERKAESRIITITEVGRT